MDLTVNLKTLAFECGLDEHEKEQLHIRARSAGLTVCGCAHGVFACKLVHSLKGEIQRHIAKGNSLASEEGSGLSVGILGMGHIGKQLALMLLERTGIKPSHIQISTRRPETSVEFAQKGIECYFDNRRLAAWADVLFLCCLPSHIPKICAELASHLPKHCLVYSYISAIPVKRLAQLLGHNFILKPQYQFVASDCEDLWLTSHLPTMALNDPMLIEASCPLAMSGGFSLGVEWVCAVLYALLNICTSANLASTEALLLINNLFLLKGPHTEEFIAQSFVNSSCTLSLASAEPFPWINLADTQAKDTPLSLFVSRRKRIQDSISTVYKSLLESSQK